MVLAYMPIKSFAVNIRSIRLMAVSYTHLDVYKRQARVWGYDSNAVENHVEVYVGFLRKKLSAINSNVRIEAVRRLGYRLEVAEG